MAKTSQGTKQDPYRNFRFRVEISGIQVAAFSEATISDATTTSTDYREGTDPPYPRKLSGLTGFGNVTLKKGVTDSLDLYNWYKSILQKGSEAQGARKNVSIILMDAQGQDKARWNLTRAWPIKYSNGDLNASSSDVMVENLEIVVETVTRVK